MTWKRWQASWNFAETPLEDLPDGIRDEMVNLPRFLSQNHAVDGATNVRSCQVHPVRSQVHMVLCQVSRQVHSSSLYLVRYKKWMVLEMSGTLSTISLQFVST